jgi:hypothetical protein
MTTATLVSDDELEFELAPLPAEPTKPPLNQGQQQAGDAFFAFLFNDEKEFIISGGGGRGKTRLMSDLIDVVMPNYFDTCKMLGIEPIFRDVKMTATTNKAAEVLAVATGRPTDTIHSFLNLKVSDDYTTGEQKLIKTTAWTVHEKLIIFIDECSMIDQALLEMIREGTSQCKIVYVGDHCQLAPVKEVISPIYRRQPPIPFYELTEPMRCQDPDIMAVQEQLRETVETGIFKPIRIVPGKIDLLNDAEMQFAIDHVFRAQTMDSRILAYTNSRVMEYNDHIRTLRQLPDEYQEGEFLVNNSAIRLKRSMLSVEEEVTIENQVSVTERMEIEDNVFLEVRRCDLRSRIGGIYENVPLPVDRAHFSALLSYYKRRKNWNRFFHLKNNFPDLRQRDAATVHKSQGSTYDSVFIDLGNISTCNFVNQVARMLYVAFTRPRTRIFLYGQLAEKYGGLTI